MAVVLPDSGFIQGSVGPDGPNDPADVLWVQGSLNRWRALKKLELLSIDGGFGRKTQAAIADFQSKELASSRTTGVVTPGDATAAKLVTFAPIRLGIKVGKNFVIDADGVSLDKKLLRRVVRFCRCLLDIGAADGNIKFNQGVRSPKTAHRWSTAWNIRKGKVALPALQALTEGKDLDSNKWYDASWENGLAKTDKGVFTAGASKQLWSNIFANAATFYASDAIAAEGYRLNDPRIKPNAHKAVSNHIDGRAMDVAIPWKSGGNFFGRRIMDGKTSDQVANRLVLAFSLSRPVKSERWHFQLPSDDSRGFVGENNLTVGGPSTEDGPKDD